MNIDQLPTPCALVDLDRVERNIEAMSRRMTRLGVSLRPHVKTHACIEAARMQVQGQAGGLTVSTLAEARAFSEAGFGDLTWAVPFSPSSLAEALDLAGSMRRLSLLLDGEEALVELERAVGGKGKASVWLKVDCGYHRAGVDPSRPESAALADRLARSESVDFRGLLTHAGHSYACRNREELQGVAREEVEVTVAFAERLRADGIEVPGVSVGSTPTLAVAEVLEGVTEVRPGNYVFFDDFQAGIGACGLDDLAFSVLTSVIGSRRDRGEALIDAGALSLSKDKGAEHAVPDAAHGRIADLDGRPRLGWRVTRLSQEHGQVALPAGADVRWGERLRVLPAHSCLAAACFDRFHVVRGRRVVDEWRPIRRH